MSIFKPQRESEVFYNTKTKLYPNGATNTIYCNRNIFKSKLDVDIRTEKRKEKEIQQAIENTKEIIDYINAQQVIDLETYEQMKKEHEKQLKEEKAQKKESSCELEIHDDSIKRAKDKVFDIVYLNPWNYFITITFSDEFVNRSDVNEVMKKLTRWLSDQVKRRGLKYILIPEYHKKGGIHCHMLCNDVFTMIDSGTKSYRGFKKPMKENTARSKGLNPDSGKTVYNIKEWKLGFSTAIEVYGERSQLSYYITKYITKDIKKIFGKYYWSSRNIRRDCEIILSNTDYDTVMSDEIQAPNSLNKFKYDSSMLYSFGDDSDHRTE